ncbi:hypothetical protein BDM02DRAFT_3120542 [Thelephora ganbajun]|uniref:Uncharacterized protein n=1 Tax=Thelephora ganbajun TaxID=370292 RepID=A0ACB6Z7I1_THEGA|nr:hypothetical protein BDM02DRAFT_3120542 [Thelephora ganbajun]
MIPLLFSLLSSVKELSATASLVELQQPEAPPELLIMPGVSPGDLLASLCPIAVALIVATIRYRNEKQMQQRTSDLHDHSSSSSAFEDANITPSETFYVSDNSIVIFRVDGTLYRVHRHYFCSEPSVFADMFVVRPPQLVEVNGEKQLEGTTDESAIEIPGVTAIEFEALLHFFYSSYDLDNTDPEHWVNLLFVATRLRFTRIRARAIQTIGTKFESMCPVEKLAIGTMLNVEEWIFSSFSKICRREKPLSDAEARRLDIVTVARIARAREAIHNFSTSTPFPADRVVKEAFEGTLS